MDIKKKTKPTAKKQQVVDYSFAGKIQPFNIEAERSVLGHLLMQPDSIDDICRLVKGVEYFHNLDNQKIFAACLVLRDKSKMIDPITVIEEMKKQGTLEEIGGPVTVMAMMTQISSSALDTFSKVLVEKYMLRQLAAVGFEVSDRALNNEDPFELLDWAEARIGNINNLESDNYHKIDEGLMKVIKRIDELRNLDQELTGVETGFPDLNKVTCGWQQPDLIILAARPSVGKTAFALNLGVNAAEVGTPVGFFSMEMSEAQLIQRIVSSKSEVPIENISRGKLTDDQMVVLNDKGFNPVFKLPFYIDDTPALNIYQLRAKARRMKKKNKVGLIIIDYLQLMSGIQNGRADNREQEISKISRDLKALAKELQVPIIALSQLSREVEKRRESKIPQLSDLRESGAIEQDADIVMFMYRPEYYNIKINEDGQQMNGETHIRFAKHRSGALELVKLTAKLSIQKFISYQGPGGYENTKPGIDFTAKVNPAGNGNWKPIENNALDSEEPYKF